MRKKIFITLSFAALFSVILSCKKEQKLNVDLTKFNIDNPIANKPLDDWLKTTFLNEYNIDVVYRYSKYYYDNDKNVAPSNLNSVKSQMQTVLDGFLLPYRKVAGEAFIKKNSPKEWVLYGSGAYQTDGSVILATASAGRRVTIYDINNFDINNPTLVTAKLRTIHHEFTHILNQLVPMPADFQNITKASYNATWTTVPDATARDNGYVTPYASSEAVEDFAETTSHLLVFGQAWFDARANASTPAGKIALKAKEASVVQYFTVNLGVDFRKLQQEVQNVVRNLYNYPNASFQYWLGQNLFKTLTVNLEDGIYTSNGISPQYAAAYNNFKAAVLAYSAAQKFHLDYVQMRFESTTLLTVRAAFSNATTQYFGDYSFSYSVNPTTGATVFVKVANGTGTTFSNGALFTAAFTNSIQSYLTGTNFTASWLPATINSDNFNSYGGFSVTGSPSNYFYGSLGQVL